ncbi:hypothetical protein KCP78_07795 [Salmonella enterica subsp. enterica]|nr:hypothetical protein KCP78_07795 [Salmonella enterica subsp. enterica]
MLRAADLTLIRWGGKIARWKTVAINGNGEWQVAPEQFSGFRWGEKAKWNLEQRDGTTGAETELQLSLLGSEDELLTCGLPVFRRRFRVLVMWRWITSLLHKLPVKRLQLAVVLPR